MGAGLNTAYTAGASGIAWLISVLESSSRALLPKELAELFRTAQLKPSDVQDWTLFDPKIYARNRVVRSQYAELLIMCWNPGQLTPIHDHTGSACAVQVISGAITEITYKPAANGMLTPLSSRRYDPGAITCSNDRDIHQLGNLEPAPAQAVTMHCYSPPLDGMQLFDESRAFFAGYDELYGQVSERLSQHASY